MMEPVPTDSPAPRPGILDVITPRRLITTALLLLAVVLTVVGFQSSKDVKASTCGNPDGPIVSYFPCPGTSVLRQSDVGVVMSTGYMVDLYIDGTPIPMDQMRIEGEIFSFTPGSGTAIGTLAPGEHTARVVYYTSLADEATGTSSTWRFSTH